MCDHLYNFKEEIYLFSQNLIQRLSNLKNKPLFIKLRQALKRTALKLITRLNKPASWGEWYKSLANENLWTSPGDNTFFQFNSDLNVFNRLQLVCEKIKNKKNVFVAGFK